MNSVTQFVNFAVVNAVGPVACEGSQSTRLELTSQSQPSVSIVVEVTPHGEGLQATISGHDGVNALTTETVHGSRGAFESLAMSIAKQLPESLASGGVIVARFSGVKTDGEPMTPATGNSIHGAIVRATATSSALAADGVIAAEATVTGILNAAVKTAVDHIDSGEGNAARVCVDAGTGMNGLWWVLLSRFEGKISAYTNDMDFLAPVGPSFHTSSQNADEVKAAIVEFLSEKYAGSPQVTVRVFREESRTGDQPILAGNSTSGGLAPQPEWPSL